MLNINTDKSQAVKLHTAMSHPLTIPGVFNRIEAEVFRVMEDKCSYSYFWL